MGRGRRATLLRAASLLRAAPLLRATRRASSEGHDWQHAGSMARSDGRRRVERRDCCIIGPWSKSVAVVTGLIAAVIGLIGSIGDTDSRARRYERASLAGEVLAVTGVASQRGRGRERGLPWWHIETVIGLIANSADTVSPMTSCTRRRSDDILAVLSSTLESVGTCEIRAVRVLWDRRVGVPAAESRPLGRCRPSLFAA